MPWLRTVPKAPPIRHPAKMPVQILPEKPRNPRKVTDNQHNYGQHIDHRHHRNQQIRYLCHFLMPPKLISAAIRISTTKEIQYNVELVAIVVPVISFAMAPTAEMVLKPCAGKHKKA